VTGSPLWSGRFEKLHSRSGLEKSRLSIPGAKCLMWEKDYVITVSYQEQSGMKKSAVFLDRDGTIIEDRGHLRTIDEVRLFPDTVPSLRQLAGHFELFIVTHQPGVSRGIVTMNEVNAINSHVSGILSAGGITIRETFVCPHDHSDNCRCIKPLPYFLLLAADKYGLDLTRSFVIGDHPHDVELAVNAGAQGIYVLTGHGAKHRHELPDGTLVMSGIGEAVQYILGVRS
jgi:D-glycero-D-manno-heptose 1,7-bisphosphate phosphatase